VDLDTWIEALTEITTDLNTRNVSVDTAIAAERK